MRGGGAMDRGEEEEVGQSRGVFDIPNKRASNSSLERWRKVVIVRNALRRFRYTANIKKREEIADTKRQLRVAILATKAALILLRDPHPHPPYEPTDGFGVHYKTLMEMLGNKDSFVKLGKAEGIANRLTVSLSDGISGTEDDVKARVNAFGQHVYKERPPRGFWLFVWEAFQDITLLILIVCALVSLAVGIPTEGLSQGWYDGGGILFSIVIIVFVTAISDYRQSLQFEELELEKKKVYLQVVRRGRRQKVLIHDLLVGDVVHLSIGDIVPADGIYVDGYSLEIDASSLTGESDPIYPTLEKPFLYGGTAVKDGSARMVVTAVGMNTQWGQVLSSLSGSGDLDETPLQVKLNGVATLVGLIGMGFAFLTFIALIVRFLHMKPSYFHWSLNDLNTILNYFAIAVTIVVVAVPEGLPLAVTLSLAYAMRQMMNDKALVRRLSACETMGSATTICSDKTGTLTTNSMEVTKVWLGGESHTIGITTLNLTSSLRDLTLEGIFQNTSGDVDEHSHNIKFLGSPTESAFLKFGYSLGGCFREIRSMSEIVQVEPFNSIKKWMGVVVKTPENKYRAYRKGAAEIIIKSCDSFIDSTGQRVAMDDFYRRHVSEIIEGFSKEALRTLCLVFKDLDHLPPKNAFPERGFTCVGVFGIKDPVRPGVRDAVNLCSKAGIKVRMVTGDSVETAKAIAQECGILMHGGIVVEGHVFRTWSESEMDEYVPKLQVMARSLPQDKLLLVKRLKKLGEVVAVTGDGTNDAPALHESDIGLSMGISGTEVAKNSSDIVILDDNFLTVVNVAKWGRSVYTNVQKFVQFQLTVNLVALAVNFISACLAGKAPLTAVQLLWVNLIMDTMGALALATEPPYDALMERKPVGRKQEFITNIMWRNIVGQAIYQLAVLLVLQYQGKELLNLTGINADEKLDTIIFNAFVFCQVFNELNCREMEKLNVFRHTLNNSIFIGVVTGTVVFQVIIVEFLGKFTSTVPLNKEEWLFSVLIGFVTIFVAFFVKFIPVPSRPFYELFQKPIQSKDPITERLLADDAC